MGDADDEEGENDGIDPSKIIVIHPGSQNLRIGFASDALPKTVPMTIAVKCSTPESKEFKPLPKRDEDAAPEDQFGEEFSAKFAKMSAELKIDMRLNKRQVLPKSKELVVNYNRRTTPDVILQHNDPLQIEWTDVNTLEKSAAACFSGHDAWRVPDDSKPSFRLFHPMQLGQFHEKDYTSEEHLMSDFETILESAIRKELGLEKMSDWEQYHCVVVIPDLYDKKYVQFLLNWCLNIVEFKQVAFIQESLAATYGAGYSSACIVDVGAQKTSICCVEDGMCIEDSRINLKYGGWDVTQAFIKMMLHDHFPYADINLMRRHDFLLAEELKINFCTMNQAEISVQLYNFHLRAPNEDTRKYQFKTYDEVILAPMGYCDPAIFDHENKLKGRHSLIKRSYNAYDVDIPDDPTSAAQLAVLTSIKPSLATTATGFPMPSNGTINHEFSTPSKEKANPFNHLSRLDSDANGNSRVTSAAASPAPEGANTPVPPVPYVFGANGTNGGSPGPSSYLANGSHNSGTPIPPAGMFIDQNQRTPKDLADERDSVLPIIPLDTAIVTSIAHAAARGDEKKIRDFFGGIMVIGGGAKTPGFGPFLEERLKLKRPDLAEKILVGTSPREMDGQVVVWKGASVFGRMKTHESWISPLEFERLGCWSRLD
ncbi:putative actin-related protein 8 [Glarea lozoyensis 74030]|uniref:Putative actin-related protein 8 n=1 Tax=Glarea lozoyensis (strain ATCC 74030 / MF5533) TaxID=1104152 RepID=H0EZ21_GLAL7|nr:putative actin-related protein 8 [Glarea lozoyensis 74030]